MKQKDPVNETYFNKEYEETLFFIRVSICALENEVIDDISTTSERTIAILNKLQHFIVVHKELYKDCQHAFNRSILYDNLTLENVCYLSGNNDDGFYIAEDGLPSFSYDCDCNQTPFISLNTVNYTALFANEDNYMQATIMSNTTLSEAYSDHIINVVDNLTQRLENLKSKVFSNANIVLRKWYIAIEKALKLMLSTLIGDNKKLKGKMQVWFLLNLFKEAGFDCTDVEMSKILSKLLSLSESTISKYITETNSENGYYMRAKTLTSELDTIMIVMEPLKKHNNWGNLETKLLKK